MGRGKARKSLELIDAAATILREIQPATVRAVCYRLFTAGLIRDMSKTATNAVSKQLVYARERELIDWSWIVDESREPERINAWSDPDSIIRAAVHGYRRDYWQEQPVRVEVWAEKGTVRGTLGPVLDEYGVTFRVMHGYTSATTVKDVADESIVCDRPMIALYLGDWDPSGLHMSEIDLPRRLARYGGSVTLSRVALAAGDVAPGTALPSFDAATKAKDPRHRWFRERYGSRCFELDAMSPVHLRARVEAEIAKHVDHEAWERAVEVEQAEIQSMHEFHKSWQASKSLGAGS